MFLCLFAILLYGSFSFSQMSPIHDHPSVHGMLMVGKNKIYLSHLPMFHSPHDYQVILEVQLNHEVQAKYFSSLDTSDETIYTLVPEVFVLPDMVKNPKPFSAKIFKGHFERGGLLIANDVTVHITKIIYFKKFSATDVKPLHGSFLLFGNKQEQFLAHTIKTKPDFDQVLKVKITPEIADNLNASGFSEVVFKTLLNSQPISENGIIHAELGPLKLDVPIQIQSSLYLELGDLSF